MTQPQPERSKKALLFTLVIPPLVLSAILGLTSFSLFLNFFIAVFIPYAISALLFDEYARKKGILDYSSYAWAGFAMGSISGPMLLFFAGFFESTNAIQTRNLIIIGICLGFISGYILSSIFWAFVVNKKSGPKWMAVGCPVAFFAYLFWVITSLED